MVKKRELATADTPRRRSKRLMKLKADDDPPGDLHQQTEPSSSAALPLSSTITSENCDVTTVNDDNDNLEDLAIDVFKKMKHMLVSISGSPSKPSPSVEQQSEILMLDSVKTPPSKRIQM